MDEPAPAAKIPRRSTSNMCLLACLSNDSDTLLADAMVQYNQLAHLFGLGPINSKSKQGYNVVDKCFQKGFVTKILGHQRTKWLRRTTKGRDALREYAAASTTLMDATRP